MYWLDTAMVLVLVMGAVFGAMTGFIWQVARVVSLALAIYASVFLNDWATDVLRDMLLQGADPRLTQGLAYAAVFFGVYISLYVVTRLLYYGIQAVDLEGVDRFFGGVVGLAKMAIILAGMSYCMSQYQHPTTQELMERSTLALALAEGMQYVISAIPDEFKDDFSSSLQTLREWARSQGSGSRNQEAGGRDQETGVGAQEPGDEDIRD